MSLFVAGCAMSFVQNVLSLLAALSHKAIFKFLVFLLDVPLIGDTYWFPYLFATVRPSHGLSNGQDRVTKAQTVHEIDNYTDCTRITNTPPLMNALYLIQIQIFACCLFTKFHWVTPILPNLVSALHHLQKNKWPVKIKYFSTAQNETIIIVKKTALPRWCT